MVLFIYLVSFFLCVFVEVRTWMFMYGSVYLSSFFLCVLVEVRTWMFMYGSIYLSSFFLCVFVEVRTWIPTSFPIHLVIDPKTSVPRSNRRQGPGSTSMTVTRPTDQRRTAW